MSNRPLISTACVFLLALTALPAEGFAQETALPSRLRAARDVTDEGLAFVEVVPPQGALYLHQVVRLRLVFGIERAFLAERAVQPFPQRLDIPAQLLASFLMGVPGARSLTPGAANTREASDETATVAVNEAVEEARRVGRQIREAQTFDVYELAIELVATRTGQLEIPAPVLALAYATRFEETLLDPRVPVDRTDAIVVGQALTLAILPIPEAGRPADFTGAVGHVSVTAIPRSSAVRLGETLKLELHIHGAGNAGSFEAPSWKEIGGFRVLGLLDDQTPTTRILTLDLAPYSAKVWQVPPIAIEYFDPGPPAAYRTAFTEPVDIEVLPRKQAPREAEAHQKEGEAEASGQPWIIGLASALAACSVLAIVMLRRRRRPPGT